ncbi:hypothetical protein NPS70_16450 [Streptomyces sp. C10-9-1]|uniref:hypothetical protein n=1 Tax=Streptomyces sp. C10-9-1 TaxID=1859285 RepID=UPI0021135027|nr:hypothetical protein [Streptomyces sp. C10-9-1]MCQ6554777.1 hypothetical protein [Streptomyces sp. C10-9-1]
MMHTRIAAAFLIIVVLAALTAACRVDAEGHDADPGPVIELDIDGPKVKRTKAPGYRAPVGTRK